MLLSVSVRRKSVKLLLLLKLRPRLRLRNNEDFYCCADAKGFLRNGKFGNQKGKWQCGDEIACWDCITRWFVLTVRAQELQTVLHEGVELHLWYCVCCLYNTLLWAYRALWDIGVWRLFIVNSFKLPDGNCIVHLLSADVIDTLE